MIIMKAESGSKVSWIPIHEADLYYRYLCTATQFRVAADNKSSLQKINLRKFAKPRNAASLQEMDGTPDIRLYVSF